jgi:hypothetical protein
MALGITVATILSNKTAAKSASTDIGDCTAIDGSALVALGIEVLLTFNASATLGATVSVYTSSDGTNYSTVSLMDFSIAYQNATVRAAFNVFPGHKNYKIVVQNLDTGQSITAIYVYSEPQVLS